MLSVLFQSIPDEQAVLALLNKFDRIIRKYSRLLNYEDAYQDLRLFFIELIINMQETGAGEKADGIIVQYISTSMKNQYIKLSKQKEREPLSFADLSDEQLRYIEPLLSYLPEINMEELLPSNGILTRWEYKVLYLIYVEQIPITRIAEKSGKSRQAINQAKNRAIKKLAALDYS